MKMPAFFPDATRGFIKSLDFATLKRTGINAVVMNTLHLYLQPGLKIIKRAGGIHKFSGFSGTILTDSGGFQIFSLIHRGQGKITDQGATFRSPIDGSKHELTPEKSIQIQFDLGSDLMVALDDCPPNDSKDIKVAVERTIAWAKRAKVEYDKQLQKKKLKIRPLLLAVIQGGKDIALRKYCYEELAKIGFDGYGFGAMPTDSNGKFMKKLLADIAKLIPKNKIKFALGIGNPEDIVCCHKNGWGLFDCVIPTREGRHGRLFTWKDRTLVKKNFYENINILNAKYRNDLTLISTDHNFPELNISRSYLRHLFKSNDPLAGHLATLNNLLFYSELMKKL